MDHSTSAPAPKRALSTPEVARALRSLSLAGADVTRPTDAISRALCECWKTQRMSTQPLADDDWRILARLLHRFAETELDQFANWRLPTTYGEVYLSISRQPAPPATDDSYGDFSGWLS